MSIDSPISAEQGVFVYYKSIVTMVMLFVVLTIGTISFAASDGNYSLSFTNVLTGVKDDVEAVSFSSSGEILASGGDDNSIILWDTKSWKEVRRLKGHKDKVSTLTFSPNGKLLASGDSGSKVILWDAVTGTEVQRIKVDDDVNAVAFSPDGKLLAIANNSRNVALWDFSQGSKLEKLVGHTKDVKSVAFSRDGKFIASGSNDKSLILWDITSGKMLKKFSGHSDDVNSIAFAANGKYLASGGNDKKIIIWDIASGTIKYTLAENSNSIKSLVFINNGDVLVSGEGDSKINCKISFWETESGKNLASGRNDCSLTGFAFSPDEKYVAIAAKKVTIKQRIATAATLQSQPELNDALAFSEVVQTPNIKADELFKRAKDWIVTNLVTSNDVLQVVDKENGMLLGKGEIIYKPDTFMSKATLTGTIRFVVKILVKDGRYKYTFTDFTHIGTAVTIRNAIWGYKEPLQLSYGLLTNAEKAPDGAEYRTSVWKHMKEVSAETANNLINSLTINMGRPVTGNNDW